MSQYYESEVAEKSKLVETQVEVTTVAYTWSIRAYHLSEGFHGCLISPPFSSKNDMDPSWCLTLNRTSDYFGIYLKMASGVTTQVRGNFKCTLTNNKGEELSTKTRYTVDFENWTIYGFEKFVKKSLIYSLDRHIELKIVCEINYMLNQYDFSDQQGFNQKKEVQLQLRQNFKYALDNEKFSDVTLSVNGENIRAHKAILTARSKVFAAMFEHEIETNCIVVRGMRSEVFMEMLTFMYSGNAPNLDELAMELLPAADMYALERLKQICEETIGENLCVETSVETLVLADLHKLEQLKSKAIDFINSHFHEVIKTESWQNMEKSRASHIFEVACLAAPTKPCK